MATTNKNQDNDNSNYTNTTQFSDVTAIGFDWSGTICDDLVAAHRAAWLLSKKLGFSIEPDPIEWGRHPSTSPASEFEARRRAGEKVFETFTVAQYAAMYGEMYESVAGYPPKNRVGNAIPVAFPSAVDAILKLHATKRFEMFVVSACPTRTLLSEITRFGLDGIFEVIVGDERDKSSAITKIGKAMEISPSNIAYIGDTIADVVAASSAGVVSIGVTCGYHGENVANAHPKVLCADVFEACRLFQQ